MKTLKITKILKTIAAISTCLIIQTSSCFAAESAASDIDAIADQNGTSETTDTVLRKIFNADTGETLIETTAVIEYPSDAGTHLPISMDSDADGVCKYLKYSKCINGSVSKQIEKAYSDFGGVRKRAFKTESLVIDKFGNVSEQRKSRVIKSITCLSK